MRPLALALMLASVAPAFAENVSREELEQRIAELEAMLNSRLDALADTDIDIHLVGHSTGAILLGHLLEGNDEVAPISITSCSLMAPACSIDFYREVYRPRLAGSSGFSPIRRLDLYNLNDELEQDDNVGLAYRKSLLYLVSRAFERTGERPLLGMDRYAKKQKSSTLKRHVSNGKTGSTRSKSHGGFDNDEATMNSILKTITRAQNSIQPFRTALLGILYQGYQPTLRSGQQETLRRFLMGKLWRHQASGPGARPADYPVIVLNRQLKGMTDFILALILKIVAITRPRKLIRGKIEVDQAIWSGFGGKELITALVR